MSTSRDRYRERVEALAQLALRLDAEGASEEQIARTLVDARNALKVEFRVDIEPRLLAMIERRNIAKYSNAVGPDADALFARYGSWNAVIAAAGRTADLNDPQTAAIFDIRRKS